MRTTSAPFCAVPYFNNRRCVTGDEGWDARGGVSTTSAQKLCVVLSIKFFKLTCWFSVSQHPGRLCVAKHRWWRPVVLCTVMTGLYINLVFIWVKCLTFSIKPAWSINFWEQAWCRQARFHRKIMWLFMPNFYGYSGFHVMSQSVF